MPAHLSQRKFNTQKIKGGERMQDDIILKYPHLYRRQGFLIKAYNAEAPVFSCSIEHLF